MYKSLNKTTESLSEEEIPYLPIDMAIIQISPLYYNRNHSYYVIALTYHVLSYIYNVTNSQLS